MSLVQILHDEFLAQGVGVIEMKQELLHGRVALYKHAFDHVHHHASLTFEGGCDSLGYKMQYRNRL